MNITNGDDKMNKTGFWITLILGAIIGITIGTIAISGTYNAPLDSDAEDKFNQECNELGLTQDECVNKLVSEQYQAKSLQEKKTMFINELQIFMQRGNITEMKQAYQWIKTKNDLHR